MPGDSPFLSAARLLRRYGFLAAVMAAGALVFWLPAALPFQDLPAHAGIFALRDRLLRPGPERAYYVFAPHLGPSIAFTVIGQALTRLLGSWSAIRLLACLPAIMTPGAMLIARRRLHGDVSPTMPLVAASFSFSYLTLLGFTSYAMALAVAVMSIAFWLELVAAADVGALTPRRLVMAGWSAVVVLLLHGLAYAYLVLVVLTVVTLGSERRRRLRCLGALVPSAAIALWGAWANRASAVAPGAAPVPVSTAVRFLGPIDKASLLLTPTLSTRFGFDAVVGAGLSLLIALAWYRTLHAARHVPRASNAPGGAPPGDGSGASSPAGASPSEVHASRLAPAVLVLAGAFVLLPHAIGWLGFIDGRLPVMILLVATLTLRREWLGPSLGAALDRVAPVTAALAVAVTLLGIARFQDEARGFEAVRDALPSGARLLDLPLDPDSDVFAAHPFIHCDKLALVSRPLVLSDIWFHQGSAVYPTPENPALRLPAEYTESNLRRIDWPAYRLADWDYVLVRTKPGAAAPTVPGALTLAVHEGGFWLFRVSGAP